MDSLVMRRYRVVTTLLNGEVDMVEVQADSVEEACQAAMNRPMKAAPLCNVTFVWHQLTEDPGWDPVSFGTSPGIRDYLVNTPYGESTFMRNSREPDGEG